ncbi:hypothetical protein [Janthinobacterium sp. CAN_S7]
MSNVLFFIMNFSSLASTVRAFSLRQAHHVGRGVLLGDFLSHERG